MSRTWGEQPAVLEQSSASSTAALVALLLVLVIALAAGVELAL